MPGFVFSNNSSFIGATPADDSVFNSAESFDRVMCVDQGRDVVDQRFKIVDQGVDLVDPVLKSKNLASSDDPKVVVTPPISFKDALAPPSPRSNKKSFDDVLDLMDDFTRADFVECDFGYSIPEGGYIFTH